MHASPRLLRALLSVWALSGLLTAFAAADSITAAPVAYSRIIAFGDSLSSGGRGKNSPSTGPAPTAENGNYPRLTWVQQLSLMAGLGRLEKWERGGANYAVGGTDTKELEEQIDRYLEICKGKADPLALYTLWSGGNDLTHYLRDKSPLGFVFSNLEKGLVSTGKKAAARVEKQITRLARAGAVHILWVNLPDLSRPPSLAARLKDRPKYRDSLMRGFRDASAAFNTRMDDAVANLRAKFSAIDLVTLDAHTFFDAVMADPTAYGFTDVTTPSRASNRHLFYDNAHPTSHGHYECARFARARLVSLDRLPPSANEAAYEKPLSIGFADPAAIADSQVGPDLVSGRARETREQNTSATRNAAPPTRSSPATNATTVTEADFIAAVRKTVAGRGVIRRPQTLAELKANPKFRMKYREKPAHMSKRSDAEWERFAISLADAEAARDLGRLLPAAAAAARMSGDPELLGYVRDQLAELATWSPLQRAGWSGGSDTRSAWLGTGWAVRAIVECAAELPDGGLTPELRAALATRFEDEITGIRDDWRLKRNWFTRIEAASSNQWVLPLEALALASLFNGLDKHRDDYEFAVAGLIRSLDAQGPQGECVEGMQYAGITFHSLLAAALAARAHGDDRLINHPWLRAFPAWYLQHRQPAGFVINAFDSQNSDLDWEVVAKLAADLADPAALWVFQHRPLEAPDAITLAIFRAAQLDPAGGAPPAAFAAWPVATRVNWVESIDAYSRGPANRVSGFWMRGGHATDAHDHQDRGHVNLVIRGRPVLIEAGLASYGIAGHASYFKSVAGHNVLQVGPYAPDQLTAKILADGAGQILDPAHRAALMTVRRLDEKGGDVSVDASGCYAGLKRWVRSVTWDAAGATIRDEVELDFPDVVLFRWHLGAPSDAVADLATTGRVRVADIVLDYETDAKLHVSLEPMPDATLKPGKTTNHATVVLATERPTKALTLTTKVFLDETR
ncbi:SGNH/GDSL hydrolase family protein [Termitidicoccus mucosus]|uniref:Heparinase II/III-like C-terminal domain-containing protein n=1 Tax=Termitidicoccus mucosus TaxID=1184151 RepID=A0A178IB66_9BACT|nr:hypothetical protein AW736_23750 [Opitutaceae bacterium TSB47]